MMSSSVTSVDAPRSEKWYDKWLWYEPGTSKEEKTLLRKHDFIILTFGCLTFFTKFLDLQAFQNAYVSGMKMETGMVGNGLQYATGVFQAGYCAAMIPFNILLTRVRYASISQ
jgi:MFS transporter, ACS family, pantothenate transporter